MLQLKGVERNGGFVRKGVERKYKIAGGLMCFYCGEMGYSNKDVMKLSATWIIVIF